MDYLPEIIAGSIAALATGAIAFFAKAYFTRLHSDIREIKNTLHERGAAGSKLEGSVEILRREVRDNTEAMVGVRSEVNAIWRFLDGAHKRTSDRRL